MSKKNFTAVAATLLLLIVPLTFLASRLLLPQQWRQQKLYQGSSAPTHITAVASAYTWHSPPVSRSGAPPSPSSTSSGRKLFLAAGSRGLQAHHHHHRSRRSQLPRRTPASPPPLNSHDIDPRYGVEKRLVPSGPNPLHN